MFISDSHFLNFKTEKFYTTPRLIAIAKRKELFLFKKTTEGDLYMDGIQELFFEQIKSLTKKTCQQQLKLRQPILSGDSR